MNRDKAENVSYLSRPRLFSTVPDDGASHSPGTVVTRDAVIFALPVFSVVTMIHVRQLNKTYKDIQSGQFTALDGISFDAMPGQIYGLLGPNGAGKTTALRILSTVLKPTSGSAIVNGFEVNDRPDMVRRQIGFVSTNTAIYDRMTAWEMVQYFGQLYGHAVGKTPVSNGNVVRAFSNERNPEHAVQQNVDRHEAKGVDRPGHDPRSARPDF